MRVKFLDHEGDRFLFEPVPDQGLGLIRMTFDEVRHMIYDLVRHERTDRPEKC